MAVLRCTNCEHTDGGVNPPFQVFQFYGTLVSGTDEGGVLVPVHDPGIEKLIVCPACGIANSGPEFFAHQKN